MNHVSSFNDTADARELVLPLTEMEHLFNASRVDPLSRSPAEVLGVSGVDYLLGLLHLHRQRQQARTRALLLPPEKATGTQAEPAAGELHRHGFVRMEQQRRELRGICHYGWKATGIAS